MPYCEMLGRIIVARESEAASEKIIEYLTHSGIDATLSRDPEKDLYIVSVPKAQQETAEKLMNRYREYEEADPDREDTYLSDFLIRSPVFVRAEDRFKDTTSSAIAFITAGGIILVVALVHCVIVLRTVQVAAYGSRFFELGLGVLFVSYGVYTMHKANEIKSMIEAENAFTTTVIEWFASTYSAWQLDDTILAASDGTRLTMEEKYFSRKDLIRSYISREFCIDDPAYLEYLAEETYISIFEKPKLSLKPPVSGT